MLGIGTDVEFKKPKHSRKCLTGQSMLSGGKQSGHEKNDQGDQADYDYRFENIH